MDAHYDQNISGSLHGHASSQVILLQNFWQRQLQSIEQGHLDFKTFQLPLARIKKVMKTDEDVKMISAEAPILFAKACEIFVKELTLRAWIHTEEGKRRTLQRNDVAAAISKIDTFDFLIDIVPREEVRTMPKKMDHDYRFTVNQEQTPYYYPSMYMQFPQNDFHNMDQMLFYQQQLQQMQYMRQQQIPPNGIQNTDIQNQMLEQEVHKQDRQGNYGMDQPE